MPKRRPVPDGVEPRTRIQLTGIVQQQRGTYFAPSERVYVCRVMLEVADLSVPILARNELAETLAGMEQDWVLEVSGYLVQHRWSTCDGRSHMETAVEAEELKRI